MKEKKVIAPNELSAGRWIGIAVVSAIVSIIVGMPLQPLLENTTDTVLGIPYSSFFGMLTFIPFFWITVLAIRFMGKTGLKDFLLGVGGKVDKKGCLTVLALFAIGIAASLLPTVTNIHLRGVGLGQFAFLFLFAALTTWMQTTWEELVFRGMFIRWACKNNVGYTKKAIIAGIVSSFIFALSHFTNPEVTSQRGLWIALAIFTYTLYGIAYYLVDLHFGSILPGIVIHWLNNFVLFTLVSGDVSAVPLPTLLVDATPFSIIITFVCTVITLLPIFV